MIWLYITVGLLMGLVFGFALEKGRVFEPGMIVGQLQLRNFIMLKMFGSAILTTLIVVGIFHSLGIMELSLKKIAFPNVILGGLIMGGGMALAGA